MRADCPLMPKPFLAIVAIGAVILLAGCSSGSSNDFQTLGNALCVRANENLAHIDSQLAAGDKAEPLRQEGIETQAKLMGAIGEIPVSGSARVPGEAEGADQAPTIHDVRADELMPEWAKLIEYQRDLARGNSIPEADVGDPDAVAKSLLKLGLDSCSEIPSTFPGSG